MNDQDQSTVPSYCSGLGRLADLMKTSGAKGILGINPMVIESNSNVVMYTGSSGNYSLAIESAGPIPNLFVNPISAFTQHNNGAIISYPRVSNTANTGVYGTLTFGVGTALNNVIPVSVNMVTGESSYLGYFGSNENGWPVSGIFDSGTNTLGIGGYDIPTCANLSFCPSSPTTVTPSIYNYDGSGTRISLSVQLSSVEGLANYSILPYWGNRLLPSYGQAIYGMPFFYGKNVYLEFYDNSQPDSYPRWGFAIQ